MVERPVLTRWDGNSASSTTSRRAELLLRNRSLFSQSLATLGYFEGKNIVIEDRSAAGNSERLDELARDVVASKVDVIVDLHIRACIEAAPHDEFSGPMCRELPGCRILYLPPRSVDGERAELSRR